MGDYRILISGDPPEWCNCLTAAFKQKNIHFEVVGCVPSAELVGTAARLYPDVVLWKVNGGNPVQELTQLREKAPFSLTVMMMRDPGEYDLMELLRKGVRGCLPLRLLPGQIVNAVELIVVAGVLCLPRFGPEFFHNTAGNNRSGSVLDKLTAREREVLGLLLRGFPNKAIASTLYLSESTVKSHLRSIFRKLGVRKRHEAQAVALQNGLIDSAG